MGLLKTNYKVYRKRNKYLYIFPEIPYWLVVNENVKNIITLFKENNHLKDVINMYYKKYGGDFQKINETVYSLYNRLKEHQVLEGVVKNNLKWEGIIDSAGISLTEECNLKCFYCYADANKSINSNKKYLEFELIKKYLDGVKKFASENCYIQITGGEPLLFKDILFDTVKYIRKIHLPHITINTNGILVDDEVAKFFEDYNVDNVTVSLDGVNPSIHDKYRGKNSFEEAIKAIETLKKYKLNITASMTVHKENFGVLKDFIKYCSKNKITAFTNPLFPVGRGESMKHLHVPLDRFFNTIADWYKQGIFTADELVGTFFATVIMPLRDLHTRHYCGAALSTVYLDTDGSVYPCANTLGKDFFRGGNIQNDEFEDIWTNSPNFKKIREKISVDDINPCTNCDIKYICGGYCRGVTYQVTNKIDVPFIWCKEIKKAIIDAMWTIGEHPEVYKGVKDKFV